MDINFYYTTDKLNNELKRVQQGKELHGVGSPSPVGFRFLDDQQSNEAAGEVGGLSNGTYPTCPKPTAQIKSKYPLSPVIGCETYKCDTVVIRQGFKRPHDWQPAIRGEIREFSSHSRQRLSFVSNNSEVEFSNMLTLTYPRLFPTDGKITKWHLDRLIKDMVVEFGDFERLWFVEFQPKRGALHYHMMTNIEFDGYGQTVVKFRKGGKEKYVTQDILHNWLSKQWTHIVHKELTLYTDGGGKIYNSPKEGRSIVAQWQPDMTAARIDDHLRAGVSWEKIRDTEGARHYVTKYSTKLEQKHVPKGFSHVGRFWGGSKNFRKVEPTGKFVGLEPMVKRCLGALDVHAAVKALKTLPKIIFNAGKVMTNELDMVKEVLISISEFRGNSYGFDKAVEVKDVRADKLMRVLRRLGIGSGEGEPIKGAVPTFEAAGEVEFAAMSVSEQIWKLLKQGCTLTTIYDHLGINDNE